MNILDLPFEILCQILHKYMNNSIISKITNNLNYNNTYTTFEEYSFIISICKKFVSVVNLMNINIIHKNAKKIKNPFPVLDNIKSNIYVFSQGSATKLVDAISSQKYNIYIVYTYNSKNIKWETYTNYGTQRYCNGNCLGKVLIVDMYTNIVILDYTLDKIPYYIINCDNITIPQDILLGRKFNSYNKKLKHSSLHIGFDKQIIGKNGYIISNLVVKRIEPGIKFLTSKIVTM